MRWKHDVIWNACALAALAGVDLERCVARKVAMNKTRTWKREQPADER
jgi:NTP pyrophosphatase (non-canonical NTP hydrolase)